MKLTHILEAGSGFRVLETTERSQTALFVLEAGEQSSNEPNVHEESDQTLVVLKGELTAEVAGERATMKAGDAVLVPAGTPHRFSNSGEQPAITFTIYAAPAYPPNEKSD
jgi:mannose-6-phosphate isomerase-like protein (cupin superfamily)